MKMCGDLDRVLMVYIYCMELGMTLSLINVYGPYLDRILFWNIFLRFSFMECEYLILEGDINFTFGFLEFLGTRASPDLLSNYFMDALDRRGLLDMRPTKLTPTRCNSPFGEDHIAKRLNRFLVSK